jgi:lipopolysaccharide transport system ATP-binding protein
MANPAVSLENLGKRFRRFHMDRPRTIQEVLMRGFQRMGPAETFWGLRNLSLEIPQGRMVGVIGRNGAGKSTLLRLIGGLGKPDEGRVRTHGRIRALLHLGAGFHPDLTGRENTVVNGVINGLTRAEVARHFDSIIDFAELEQYVDTPLRAYSSGMQMRLAFSIVVHSNPDIFLIDEVLAVGDVAIQQKCLRKIKELRDNGCTIVVVSHDAGMVLQLCQDAIWLDAGKLSGYGPSSSVVPRYLEGFDLPKWSEVPVAH